MTVGALLAPLHGADDTGERERTALAVEALSRLQGIDVNQNPKLKAAVLKVLEKTRGTPQFVQLVKQFKLTDQNEGLLEVAIQHPAEESGVEAMRLLLANQADALIEKTLQETNAPAAAKTAEALGNTRESQAAKWLLPVVSNDARDLELRKQAARALAQTSEGAAALLQMVKDEKLPDDLRFVVGAELNHVRWPQIKAAAAELLPLPQGRNAKPLPPLGELLTMHGHVENGERVFFSPTAGCANCHKVKGKGAEVGPDLSEIGSKLGKEGLYEAILDPSAGISFGYEAWQIELKSGDEAYGLLVSDTPEEVAVKDIKGIVTRYPVENIASRQKMKLSIMPTELQQTMSSQDLVDLVEYLASLKKVE